MSETVIRSFRAIGATEDVTTCDYCGRIELKGTVVLAILDEEGNNTGEVVYYGVTCAATAGKRTVKAVRDEVREAERARIAAERAAQDAEHWARIVARDEWIAANYGPDALDYPGRYGFRSPTDICRVYFEWKKAQHAPESEK